MNLFRIEFKTRTEKLVGPFYPEFVVVLLDDSRMSAIVRAFKIINKPEMSQYHTVYDLGKI